MILLTYICDSTLASTFLLFKQGLSTTFDQTENQKYQKKNLIKPIKYSKQLKLDNENKTYKLITQKSKSKLKLNH